MSRNKWQWELALWLARQDISLLQGPSGAISATSASGGDSGTETRAHLCPHTSSWGWDTPPSSACPNAQLPSPAWHTSKGKGRHERAWWDTREARGFDGDVASPTAGHQPGGSPAAAGSALGSCVRGKPPAPPTDTGGRVMALPLGHRVQRCWAGLVAWQGAARRPGSPVPAGRRLAAGQRCPSAQGPQSGTRHCQQAACCLLDSEIWPQLARIQFNYDKQRLHPLSRD